MISERARVVTASYVASDLVATGGALVAAHEMRRVLGAYHVSMGPLYPLSDYVLLGALILPLWLLVFHLLGLYGRRSARTLRTEMSRVAQAVGVCGLLLAFVIFAAKLDFVSRPLVLLFLVLNGVFVVIGRGLVRALVLDSTTRRRVLIAGAREESLRAAAAVDAHRDWGLEVVGLASDGSWSNGPVSGYRVLGSYADVPRIVQAEVVDEVVIAAPIAGLEVVRQLEPVFLQLEELGIVTRVAVDFLPRSMASMSFDELSGMPLLTFSTAPRDELLLFIRRCTDAVLAAVLLVLLSPVFAGIAIAIKLTSRGPVLFRQTRCGLHGRPFTFLKFRSMRVDAEQLKPSLAPFNEMDGPAFKMTNDPRLTSIGGWLRRTSLDELPQLWNILVGDMSFVGPRPSVIEEVRQYEPWQRRRLSMKPGLTCLWQVSGRSELTFDEWMRLDLEYIDNWSLWLDLKIALLTIPAVLLGRGAK
jgi:exopolysaccharide biosynthesis polyprenyl glycosylphosphotransferase